MPGLGSRLRYLDHIESRGVDGFRAACERDLEAGVTAVAVYELKRVDSDFFAEE